MDAATGRPLPTVAFDRSQQAFISFRKDNCAWLATAVGVGTGSGDVPRACGIRMAPARTKELQAQVQGVARGGASEPPPQRDVPAGLTSRAWRLTQLLRDGQPLALSPESLPTIEFDSLGRVSGNASVNRFSGDYAVDAS